jgi:thioredoxin 1
VDFSAAWCGPCKVIAPHVAALADQYAGKLVAVTVDIDTCTPVAEQYDVQAVPTLLLFKDGQVVGQLVGALPRAKLDAFVQKVL